MTNTSKLVTLTNFAIVPCLRKSPHLIAEFYWILYPCKQIKKQITTQLTNGFPAVLLRNYPCKYGIQ